jgi:uncharacterized protein (TIGR02246 family)
MPAQFSLRSALLAAVVFAGAIYAAGTPASAADTDGVSGATAAHDETAIRQVLSEYNAALNGGNTAAVLPLYSEDGVFMPPYSQSAIGKAAVAQAYDKVFEELKFQVKFNIAEIHVLAPHWAFVRTNSAGTTLHHSSSKATSEANQELFIFHKDDDGQWRIARYSFSPTNRPAA